MITWKKKNEQRRKRRGTSLNFELVSTKRRRTHRPLKTQNVRKTNETFDELGCSPFMKTWIVQHFFGNSIIYTYVQRGASIIESQ